MGLTTRTLPSINNGISRQPAILRSFDQTEDEINTWGRLASGLDRRPPTEMIAKLATSGLDTAFIHHINRDLSERYVVVVDQGVLRVFDHASGAEKTVSAPGGLGYLSAPGTAYRAVTVADYTFIVNTASLCALEAAGTDTDPQPNYYVFPGGTASYSQTEGELALAGSAYQYAPNPATGVILGEVQKFEDLPASAPDGAVYKVVGSAETGFISYYVRRSGAVWDETVMPELANALDAATMPHALVRQADGTFTFAPFSWKPRRVGDTTTNPAPPFINRRIRDVFFYANRLGFLVDESVVFSSAGDYGDFWRRTVLDYIQADTLSVAATTTDVAVLDYAVPFNDGIMLFSGQRQFSLSNGESGLSADSVAIRPVTGFVMSQGVRPVPLGSNVYFPSDSAGYVAVQEYTRLDGADATDAADITAHVPDLIPRGVSQLIAAPDTNAVFMLTARSATAAARSRMFVYQFFWDGDRKLQSAWRRWVFEDGEPVSGAYFDGRLYLVMKRPDGYFLERINLSPGSSAANQTHQIYLDRSASLTGVYNAASQRTTFTLPYAADHGRFRLVRSAEHPVRPEGLIDASGYVWSGNTVSVFGDESGQPVTGGEQFTTFVQFSRQYPVDYQSRPLSTGRLQIHTFTVVYENTAFFETEVFPYGRGAGLSHAETFTAKKLGDSALVLNRPVYGSGGYTFGVSSDAAQGIIALSNSSPYASTWVSAEWEGLYFNRALGQAG